jgi:hypothetical protein
MPGASQAAIQANDELIPGDFAMQYPVPDEFDSELSWLIDRLRV